MKGVCERGMKGVGAEKGEGLGFSPPNLPGKGRKRVLLLLLVGVGAGMLANEALGFNFCPVGVQVAGRRDRTLACKSLSTDQLEGCQPPC